MKAGLLSKRFKNDGKPTLKLNQLQLDTKMQIEEKITKGIYSFEEVPCCVCGGRGFEPLAQKERYGLFMSVVICRECGLVQTNPRMTQESYNEFYQMEYRKLYVGKDVPTDVSFRGEYNKGNELFSFLTRNLGIEITKLFIVEVGCAAGGILQYFKEQGNEVYGVDLDSQGVEFGKANYGLKLEVGTVDKVVQLHRNPDIVIYADVLEHLLNPIAELSKLRETMKESSFLCFRVPNIKILTMTYQRDFLRFLQNAHTYHFTLVTLHNCLRKAGYDFVCGNDSIFCVFRTSPLTKGGGFYYETDYQSVMGFLRQLEFTRLLPSPYRLRSVLMGVVVRLLKATNLYDVARKVHHRFI